MHVSKVIILGIFLLAVIGVVTGCGWIKRTNNPCYQLADQIRSEENIQCTIQYEAASINMLYRKELKESPTMSGKVTTEIRIAKSGSVKSITVISTGITNTRFLENLVKLIKSFDFGPAKNEVVIRYPLDFFPN